MAVRGGCSADAFGTEALMMARPLATLSVVFAALLSTATPAQGVQTAKPDPSGEKICEKITVTGSRLATRKLCATRAEWAERRRQDRDIVEGIQMLRLNPCNSVNQAKGGGNC